MQSIGCRLQGNGLYQGWLSFTGATFAYQTADDSDGTTHDDAASYFTLDKFSASTNQGIVSFPVFLQAEFQSIAQITVNVVARRGGAAHPRILIGFQRGGTTAFDATMFNPGASFSLSSRAFTLSPFTGLAWDAAELHGTELCVMSESGVNGNNDVTLVSASVDYDETRAWRMEMAG